MQFYDSPEQSTNHATHQLSDEVLKSCRSHLESMQNLRHLVTIDVYSPQQVMLHLRMMDWHLRNLAEILLEPRIDGRRAEAERRESS
jgi:hypothetical protein